MLLRRKSRIVSTLGEVCRPDSWSLLDSRTHLFSLVWKDTAIKWSSLRHSAGFVGTFILSCDVYVAIRIIAIHLESNRYIYISTHAFKVCQVSLKRWNGNVLLVSTKTPHKSISRTLWIFSISFMASELLTTSHSGQEMHLSTLLAVSQVTDNSC